MKTLGLACLAVVVFVSAAGTASAQGMANGPRFTGVWRAVVGGGAVYEFQTEGKPKRTVEVDIVGKDSAAGKDGLWVEVTMNVPNLNNADMRFKELVAFDTSSLEMQVLRAILQMPGGPPMEMPDGLMHMRQPVQFTDVRGDAENLGSDSVTTPAGTFSCEHYRAKDGSGEFWVSEKVAPFGLVKGQDKTQTTITLIKTVADAKDKIIGTPQPFDPMKMMQQQPQ